jgi:2-polyprenyl-3-methyl-5-hydroxy-6-metoxy-1,4-benzoquinol methylase
MTTPLRTEPAAACPRCGGPGFVAHDAFVDRILAAPGTWSVRRCDPCGLAWLDPQPHPDDLGRLYEGSYMTHAASASDAVVDGLEAGYLQAAYGYGGTRAAGWLRALRPLDDLLGGRACWLPAMPGGTVLDVGCGSGAFLARMRHLGWQVAGVEPDPAAAAAAREVHGIDVEADVTRFAGRTFNAITKHHVIEHLPAPEATVASLAARLAPGGRLVIVTPNIDSAGRRRFGAHWVHWDPPRHLRLFSLRALTNLATGAGLVVERGWTTGRYARFVWTASTNIAATGRVGEGAIPAGRRLASFGFQAVEQVRSFLQADAGEELVVIARRP